MLGIVGDLGSDRIIAWEVTSDLDTVSLELEVQRFRPRFSVESVTTDVLSYVDFHALGACDVGGFLYVDLWREDGTRFISRKEFFKRFKRAF